MPQSGLEPAKYHQWKASLLSPGYNGIHESLYSRKRCHPPELHGFLSSNGAERLRLWPVPLNPWIEALPRAQMFHRSPRVLPHVNRCEACGAFRAIEYVLDWVIILSAAWERTASDANPCSKVEVWARRVRFTEESKWSRRISFTKESKWSESIRRPEELWPEQLSKGHPFFSRKEGSRWWLLQQGLLLWAGWLHSNFWGVCIREINNTVFLAPSAAVYANLQMIWINLKPIA